MKRNTIGMAVACSVLCAAFSQSVEAASRVARVDEFSGSGWEGLTSLSLSTTYNTGIGGVTLTPGVPGAGTTYAPYSISFNPAGVSGTPTTDDVAPGDGLYIASTSVLYNWYPTSAGAPAIQSTPQDQIAVYTLANNSSNSSNLLAGQPSLQNDIEVQFAYTDSTTASFTIGGYKYTTTGSAPGGDFLFSSTGGFLGSLSDDGSGVSLTSASTSLSAALGGWTQTAVSGTTTSSAPEIDSTSAMSALTLLAGVLAIVPGLRTGRRRFLAKC